MGCSGNRTHVSISIWWLTIIQHSAFLTHMLRYIYDANATHPMFIMAGAPRIERGLFGPKPNVLPLDDAPIIASRRPGLPIPHRTPSAWTAHYLPPMRQQNRRANLLIVYYTTTARLYIESYKSKFVCERSR